MFFRLFAVISLLLLSGRVSAQLRNADFEDWAGPSLHPIGWQHDGRSDTIGGYGTAQTDTAEHGSYALKLYRWYGYVWDWVTQTVPESERPTMLRGYYRYTDNLLMRSNPLDTAIIWVSVTRWNSGTGKNDTVGYAAIELGAADTFTSFAAPIHYSSSLAPDSLTITISPTLGYQGGTAASGNDGSYLTVDNLSLETTPVTPPQTFTTIGTDKSGDVQPPGYANDMKTLSYAVDKAQDSLWFRIESYDTLQGDFGFAIGLDTDNDITNGHAWGGANQSMKYDLVVFIQRDIVLPTMIFGGVETGPSQTTSAHFEPRVVDPHTIEVNLKLSEITTSGVLHIVAGSGAFDVESNGDIYDDLPDKTYITLDLQADVAARSGPLNSTAAVYPNPGADRITIDRPDASLLRVTDATGREVNVPSTQTSQGLELSTRRLPNGIYLLTYRSSGTTHTDKFVIRK